MSNKITYTIIAGVIIGVIVLGTALILSLTRRQNSEIDTDKILGMSTKEISLSEVNKNNTAASCWTIVGGIVYDATKVITNNPQHKDILVKACGIDGADYYTVKKFESQELSQQQINDLFNQLKNNRLGIITPTNQ